MEIDAYLRRINYDGPAAPTADTLRALHLAHLQSVPFENLDIHLERPILLDEASLYDKIVLNRRGGFCYEQNGLFAWALRSLGFDVTMLSARVAGKDGRFGPEFDHMALRVLCPADRYLLAVPWLADVGFGDSFRLPLRLDRLNMPQQEGSRAYSIEARGGYLLLLQQEAGQPWAAQYRFTLEPRRLADFEQMCAYHQTSPASHFTQRRICSLATENGRITLSERLFIETIEGARQERTVSSAAYGGILLRRFGLSIPPELAE